MTRRHAGRAASGPRAALSAAALALLAGTALAGDRALLDVIGYSADARYFAFEEFGIQDGSGFPYSNIYVVDLRQDSWVIGTPFRLREDDEATRLADVRRHNAEHARPTLASLGIERPAEILALVGDGVAGDARSLAFGTPGFEPGTAFGNYTLELESFETTGQLPCETWFDSPPLGFALTLVSSGAPRLLHRDDSVPRSRGCPLAYRLHAVVSPFQEVTISHAVAIVSVYPGGFEGPDRRFLAVPIGQ